MLLLGVIFSFSFFVPCIRLDFSLFWSQLFLRFWQDETSEPTHSRGDTHLLHNSFYAVPYLPFHLAYLSRRSAPHLHPCGTNAWGVESWHRGRGSRLRGNGETQWCDSVPKVYRRADIVRRWGKGLKRGCLSLCSLGGTRDRKSRSSPLMHCKANFKQTWPLAWWLSKAMLHAIRDWSAFSAKSCLEVTNGVALDVNGRKLCKPHMSICPCCVWI